MEFSKRVNRFGANIFHRLDEKKKERLEQGRPVYNLSVGTPDFAPMRHIMEAVSRAAMEPDNYKYSMGDTPELLSAVQQWYQRRYEVELDESEIMSVAGTQEGMAHLAMAVCNPGEVVLVPNPCYPIFEIGPYLCGARVEYYDLLPEQDYLPDFDSIPEELLQKAKMMVFSYPSNPSSAAAPEALYEKMAEIGHRYDILMVHDNAYSEIIYDGRKGISFLQVPGASEVGVEFNSLSKTYNLTGIRISFLLGNREVIHKFRTLRSQFDYGTSLLVQTAAIAALEGPQEEVLAQCRVYQDRRDALCQGLRSIGWDVRDAQGSMFVWAKIPENYADSMEFCLDLIERTGVICTPGSSFGSLGEGYVRFALVLPVEDIKEIVEIIRKSGIIISD
ncbi:MAG: aminotransferase class I/II-fold pyridoxal phosphate-dependent enzyme [Lachnospiraceae bacterium]